ncbi:hypothetical protein D3C76_1739790 [compost metagenome]
MNQVKMAPNMEIAIIKVNELSGYRMLSKVARAMPELDNNRAFSGIPLLLNLPMDLGA